MSRLIKIILICAYSVLFVKFLSFLTMDTDIEIVEIKYVLERSHDFHKNKLMVRASEYKKLERLPTDYKYVLKWTPAYTHFNAPVSMNGQRPFLESNCSVNNCYITNDRYLLSDIRHYDAILFDHEESLELPPQLRSPHQKYIFLSSEPSDIFPTCNPFYDNFYNLTWTYKLDSDIRWSHVTILDVNGSFVGPKVDMHWVQPMLPTPDSVRRVIQGKNKTAAWFVSNCNSKNNVTNVTDQINYALKRYGLEIDVYGWCGKLRCPKDRLKDCLDLLEKQYYFYLAFETSMAEDYVTEKLLHAVQHHTVPIVYGGANYSRFLPPGSYINAKELGVIAVAHKMFQAISHPEIYENYFRWHNHYKYKHTPEAQDVCKLCEILNVPSTSTVKKNFRRWWNKDFKQHCILTPYHAKKILRKKA